MKRIGAKELHALLYAGNQAVAVLTTVLVIRFGKEAFGLTWTLGAILVLGWGTVGYGMLAPALSARLWSIAPDRGLRLGTRTLLAGTAVLLPVIAVPRLTEALNGLAGIGLPWLPLFAFLGLLRGHAQAMSTFSIRSGRHGQVLRHQLAGRVLEILLATVGCLSAQPLLLAAAWAAYPLTQLLLLLREWTDYKTLPATDGGTPPQPNAWLPTLASQGFDMAMPTLWLHLGGEAAFVAYRAVTAALANSALLPRYWYVVVSPGNRPKGEGAWIFIVSFIPAMALAAIFLLGTGSVSTEIILWSGVPLLINSLVTPAFSRMRQDCLNRGELIQPAVAVILGHLAEAALLFAFSAQTALPPACVLVAYSGYAVSALALRWFTWRQR